MAYALSCYYASDRDSSASCNDYFGAYGASDDA